MVSPLDLTFRATARMPIRHPVSGEVLTMPDGREQYLELYGIDTPQFRRAMAEAEEAYPADAGDPAETRERQAVHLVAACTAGWLMLGSKAVGGIVDEDQCVPFSQENARLVYALRPWLRAAADRWIAQREQYLGEG